MTTRNPRPKILTREQVAKKQEKAVRFVRDVVGDDALADEIESLTVEEYAERKRVQLANPPPGWRVRAIREGGDCMPKKPSYSELQEENEQLWSTLEDVRQQLDDLLEDEEDEDENEGE